MCQLQNTGKQYCFTCRPGGILVCKLEGASFWEKTPGADYLPHTMTLPEGNVLYVMKYVDVNYCM